MVVAARKGGQLTAARAWLRESAELAVYGGYPLRMLDILEQGGHLCAATGRPAEAVTLWSARTAQCQAAGLGEPPQEKRDRERPLTESRGPPGAQHSAAAQHRAPALPLTAAVEVAVLT